MIFVLFLGHCVEFNVRGGVIQDQKSAFCTKTFPKCDRFYYSTDAYKCKVWKVFDRVMSFHLTLAEKLT